MFKQSNRRKTSINVNDSVEGETIEQKIERIVNNKEPISDGAPTIFTERKDGVQPGYNIRTDRFEVAVEAMDKVSKTHAAKREGRLKEREKLLQELHDKENGKAESTQGNQGKLTD